jgi:hypothetical protein
MRNATTPHPGRLIYFSADKRPRLSAAQNTALIAKPRGKAIYPTIVEIDIGDIAPDLISAEWLDEALSHS